MHLSRLPSRRRVVALALVNHPTPSPTSTLSRTLFALARTHRIFGCLRCTRVDASVGARVALTAVVANAILYRVRVFGTVACAL